MSLFGTSPPSDSGLRPSRNSLFDDDEPASRSAADSLFNDDDLSGSGAASPWDMPTPRKQQSRADLIRNLLSGVQVPDSYVEAFDYAVQEDGRGGKVSPAGISKTLAAAKLGADEQAQVMSILSPNGEELDLGRDSFNVLLALIGLAQEGESVSLDGVDERRRNLPQPQLSSIPKKKEQPVFDASELAAKPPQAPETPRKDSFSQTVRKIRKPSMTDPEDDPWGSPDLHRGHNHAEVSRSNGAEPINGHGYGNNNNIDNESSNNLVAPDLHQRTTSNFTTHTIGSGTPSGRQSAASGPIPETPRSAGGWNYFDGANPNPDQGFGASPSSQPANPFGGVASQESRNNAPTAAHSRTLSASRIGSGSEENILVNLMPEKEGMFMFQHHNYEVTSSRRGSKVIRRYSDFVWLLDCLHKRYPFRVLPLLPPKRVALNGNHLSNDGGFIEKRRRGLARFLNAIIRHPVMGQEQLVVMFLTVPTELSVWRKQATISAQDEFTDRALPPGLEDSLPIGPLNELFERTRAGVRRSADLYINTCNLMDRLAKRSEGVAADHARMAVSLASMTEVSADTYATDTNDVPLLNDGLVAMSKRLKTAQGLLEDESKAWETGVLEDLKRQRDALVSVREMFDRRERLDKDNIPTLERRIQNNETKLAGLRAKPEGLVKPGEVERVVESIIKDKESIVNQHNRSVFVRETLRDELIYFQQTQYQVSRWNQDWAQERVKYSEMLADNWRRLLDELDGMPLGE
ncbi:Sorting nexin mvp1 [Pestalotiopsis sp. 9143b]|nr:Sorting nexin mvp1 [Pestalotiopsis sp. 9143b]